MNIVLEYELASGTPRKVWLHPDQVLRFGRSLRADIVVDADPDLAEIHFVVTGIGDKWTISSLGRNYPVFANGQLVNDYVLRHGDQLQAGNTVFRIAIDGKAIAPVQEIQEVHRSEPIAETQPLSFVVKQHPSKVAEFKLQIQDSQIGELLEDFLAREPWANPQLYVALNAKRFGKSPTTWKLGEKDLFEQAPEEIRATDSLAVTLLDKPLSVEVVRELQLASRSDAACLILSPMQPTDFLEAHKIGWAWFSRPSILAQQLSLGSSVLAEKLLLDGELAVLFNPAANSGLKLLTQVAERDTVQRSLEPIRLRTF